MQDFHTIEKIRNNMCEFPYEFENANSKSRFTLTTAQDNDQYSSLPHIASEPGGPLRQNGLNPNNSQGRIRYGRGVSAGAQRTAPVIRQADVLDEKRVVLYRKSKQLGQGYYLVEISTNQSMLFIAAFDVETDESLLIELPQRKAHDILREFNNDYEQLASSLQVINKRLVLLNPVSHRRPHDSLRVYCRNSSSRSESVRHPPLEETPQQNQWAKPRTWVAAQWTPLMRVVRSTLIMVTEWK